MEDRPNYYAIIPANVRYDKNLTSSEKLLYGEITALTQKTGECWASNTYFSKLYGVTVRSITNWIANLEKQKYIKTKLIRKENSKEIEKRVIMLGIENNFYRYGNKFLEGYGNKCEEGIEKNFQENNTSINNININNNSTTIYDFLETNFGRCLTPIEYEQVNLWNDTELTRYAIKQAVLNGKYNIKYIDRILQNYKVNNIQTIQQAQQEEQNFKESKTRRYTPKRNNTFDPSIDVEENVATPEEIEELERKLRC